MIYKDFSIQITEICLSICLRAKNLQPGDVGEDGATEPRCPERAGGSDECEHPRGPKKNRTLTWKTGGKPNLFSKGKGLEHNIFWMNNVGLGLCFVRFFPSLDVERKHDRRSLYRLKDRTDCAISLEATDISKSTSLGKKNKNTDSVKAVCCLIA